MSREDSKKVLKDFGLTLVKQAEKGENPWMDVPIRALSNVVFNQKSKTITMGDKSSKRYFFNVAHVRKFVQTVEAAATAKEMIGENKHLSLRQTFYRMRRTIPGTNIDIVDEQEESNKAIEEDKGDIIDWSKLGSGGWAIPSNVEDIKFKKVSAKFVIYMEKAAMWERLHEDRIWEKMDCIIMASQGQATRGIRRLLERLHHEHKLPVYVLVDGDPWGAYIYSVLKYGSISLAHISEKLAIPGVRFLGLSAEDVTKYGLQKHKIKFQPVDIARIKQVRKYAWFKDNKDWQRQFDLWEKFGGKVELDALVNKGISFVSETYIPDKIKHREWLE
jgi:DNA topoisomerase-6 subunit A